MKNLFKILLSALVLLALLSQEAAFAQSNWDKVLDRYELICSQCLTLREKMSNGESVSSKSVTSLLQELSSLRATLSEASGSMTTSQKNRFNKIRDNYSAVLGTSSSKNSSTSVSSSAEAPKASSETKSSSKTARAESSKASDKKNEDTTSTQRTFILIDKVDSLISAPILNFDSEASIARKSASPSYSDMTIDQGFQVSYNIGALGIVEIGNPLSLGVMAFAKVNKIGGYVLATTSFSSIKDSYSCSSNGSLADGGNFWGSGKSKGSTFKVIAGPMMNFSYGISAFAGCGYGCVKHAWEDVSGDWALVEDKSGKGFLINAGAMKTIGRLAVSASVIYMPKTSLVTPAIGVGVQF